MKKNKTVKHKRKLTTYALLNAVGGALCVFIGHIFKNGMTNKFHTNFSECSRCKCDVPFYPILRGYRMKENGEWEKVYSDET